MKRIAKNKWRLIEKKDMRFFQCKVDTYIMNYSTVSSDQSFLDYFKPILLKQIHSDTIINVDNTRTRVGDGMITQNKDLVLGIKIADCLPVFLFNEQRSCVIHCGWRGIVNNIARNASMLMREYRYILGACIGPCCYEVGEDTASFFKARYKNAVTCRKNKYFVDLKAAVIEDLGRDRLVGNLGICTKCHPEYFYSYRRGDKNKRNYSVAMGDERKY